MRKLLVAESARLEESNAKPPAPTMCFKHGPPLHAPSAGGGVVGGAAGGAALDALLPRVDLMSKLKSDILKRLKEGQWKDRKEALDEVLHALQEHARIAPGVGALIDAIRCAPVRVGVTVRDTVRNRCRCTHQRPTVTHAALLARRLSPPPALTRAPPVANARGYDSWRSHLPAGGLTMLHGSTPPLRTTHPQPSPSTLTLNPHPQPSPSRRPRLKDNQVAIILAALHTLGALAPAVGKAIKTHLRAAVPEILLALGDGKQQVRDTALETLDKWVGEVAFEVRQQDSLTRAPHSDGGWSRHTGRLHAA